MKFSFMPINEEKENTPVALETAKINKEYKQEDRVPLKAIANHHSIFASKQTRYCATHLKLFGRVIFRVPAQLDGFLLLSVQREFAHSAQTAYTDITFIMFFSTSLLLVNKPDRYFFSICF